MRACGNPACGKPLSDDYRGAYCDNGGACKQAAYRARQSEALDPELLARRDLVLEAIKDGARPWVAFFIAHLARTADEARRFLEAAT